MKRLDSKLWGLFYLILTASVVLFISLSVTKYNSMKAEFDARAFRRHQSA
ncbi:hypothetical protein [Hydrogenovibrio thermophilus]|nr:hypothetical protein [Hydrogenovibrio thermophilus]